MGTSTFPLSYPWSDGETGNRPCRADGVDPRKVGTERGTGKRAEARTPRCSEVGVSNPRRRSRKRSRRGRDREGGVENEPIPTRDYRPTAGFVAEMASEPIFRMFPEAGSGCTTEAEIARIGDSDHFLQKQYPMLHMNLSAREHPSIKSVRHDSERSNSCPLCKTLDKNTLDSVKVLEPHEVQDYLKSCRYVFTEKQVNVHLAHIASDENTVTGVLRNMSVDLISGSYALASQASHRVMNRVQTHMGRVFLVPDQAVAKVHNDAVKQFIGLAATCQSLMKYKGNEPSKGSSGNTSSSHPLL